MHNLCSSILEDVGPGRWGGGGGGRDKVVDAHKDRMDTYVTVYMSIGEKIANQGP